jgi:hypothetical protein
MSDNSGDLEDCISKHTVDMTLIVAPLNYRRKNVSTLPSLFLCGHPVILTSLETEHYVLLSGGHKSVTTLQCILNCECN